MCGYYNSYFVLCQPKSAPNIMGAKGGITHEKTGIPKSAPNIMGAKGGITHAKK
jgi:hypothetical protein